MPFWWLLIHMASGPPSHCWQLRWVSAPQEVCNGSSRTWAETRICEITSPPEAGPLQVSCAREDIYELFCFVLFCFLSRLPDASWLISDI